MLGEQLIKNERIALIELIKNAYDADSPWVKISFVGFDDGFRFDSESKIVIEDSGCGMNAEIIEEHWLNPATPEKLRRKAEKIRFYGAAAAWQTLKRQVEARQGWRQLAPRSLSGHSKLIIKLLDQTDDSGHVLLHAFQGFLCHGGNIALSGQGMVRFQNGPETGDEDPL
jgi:hypothetical protein